MIASQKCEYLLWPKCCCVIRIMFVWIDETGCDARNYHRKFGYSPRSISIMDNCAIHHVQMVEDLFTSAGILI